jgi:hypothetical protein
MKRRGKSAAFLKRLRRRYHLGEYSARAQSRRRSSNPRRTREARAAARMRPSTNSRSSGPGSRWGGKPTHENLPLLHPLKQGGTGDGGEE